MWARPSSKLVTGAISSAPAFAGSLKPAVMGLFRSLGLSVYWNTNRTIPGSLCSKPSIDRSITRARCSKICPADQFPSVLISRLPASRSMSARMSSRLWKRSSLRLSTLAVSMRVVAVDMVEVPLQRIRRVRCADAYKKFIYG